MSQPFIFISTTSIKPGKLEDFTRYWQTFCEAMKARQPRLIAFNGYVNDAGTEFTVVQVHPDEASMQNHMTVAQEHIGKAYAEFLDATSSTQVYGTLSAEARGMMQSLTGPGVTLSVSPTGIGGFTRSAAE